MVSDKMCGTEKTFILENSKSTCSVRDCVFSLMDGSGADRFLEVISMQAGKAHTDTGMSYISQIRFSNVT